MGPKTISTYFGHAISESFKDSHPNVPWASPPETFIFSGYN